MATERTEATDHLTGSVTVYDLALDHCFAMGPLAAKAVNGLWCLKPCRLSAQEASKNDIRGRKTNRPKTNKPPTMARASQAARVMGLSFSRRPRKFRLASNKNST
jgi:hypothetical protein